MKQYVIVATKQYRKDYKRLLKTCYDMAKLEIIIDALASDKKLENKYHDHDLQGKLKGMRECHIGPDWLLQYKKDDAYLILLLIRTGDHRHVLGIE